MFSQYKRPLSFMFASFKGHRQLFYIFIIGKVFEGMFYVGLPVLAKMEMDQLVEQNEQLFGVIELSSFNIFIVILTLIFGIKLVEKLLQSFLEFFQFDYAKMYDNSYNKALYNRLKYAEPGIFLNARNKRFINEILEDGTVLSDSLRNFVGQFISNTFLVLGVFTILSMLNIWIFVVLLCSSIIIYFLEKLRQSIEEKKDFEDKYEYDEKVWLAQEQLGRKTSNLIASGGFFSVLEKYNQYNEELRKKIKERNKGDIFLSVLSFVTENVGEILIKLIVGWTIFFSTASVGTMTMTLMYVGRMNSIFSFFRTLRLHLNRFIDNLKKLDIFLDITEVAAEKTTTIENFSTLEFTNVGFSYPNFAKHEIQYLKVIEDRIKSYNSKGSHHADELHMIAETKKELQQTPPVVLRGVDLLFEKGKTYGLVGRNGAGKSTIISLLQNFFENFSGDILLDNQDIRMCSREFFEKNISVINQIPYIIEGFSIKENLLLGVEKEYSDEYIVSLLEKFGLAKKIQKNRKGLDTRIAYDNDFSGGEKQILVLIRIILQDKPILIMDEGTNQLDAENEQKVMDELLKNKAGKIVIFITHRMTTIKKADLIYCLEDGKISASGTHQELIGKKNIYNDFWNRQVGE